MKAISLKLKEPIFEEVEKIIAKMKISRNRYFNDAIELYNQTQARELIKKQLIKESNLVKEESLKVLEEFEKFEE